MRRTRCKAGSGVLKFGALGDFREQLICERLTASTGCGVESRVVADQPATSSGTVAGCVRRAQVPVGDWCGYEDECYKRGNLCVRVRSIRGSDFRGEQVFRLCSEKEGGCAELGKRKLERRSYREKSVSTGFGRGNRWSTTAGYGVATRRLELRMRKRGCRDDGERRRFGGVHPARGLQQVRLKKRCKIVSSKSGIGVSVREQQSVSGWLIKAEGDLGKLKGAGGEVRL